VEHAHGTDGVESRRAGSLAPVPPLSLGRFLPHLVGRDGAAGVTVRTRLLHIADVSVCRTEYSWPRPEGGSTSFIAVGRVISGRFMLTAGGEGPGGGATILFPDGGDGTDSRTGASVRLTVQNELPPRSGAERAGAGAPGFRFLELRPRSSHAELHLTGTLGYVDRLVRAGSLDHPLLLAATTQLVAASLLSSFPNTGVVADRAGEGGDERPAAVRRATAFIEEHAGSPLTAAEIAEAAGVGVRALQHAFRRHHGMTPTAYLRRARLERAHQDLVRADRNGNETVAAIAARWGFQHAGRFAAWYREAYGQPPRATFRA